MKLEALVFHVGKLALFPDDLVRNPDFSYVMKKPSGLRIRAVRSVFLLQARGSRKTEQ